MDTKEAIQYLDNTSKKLNDKNAYKILDKITATLYDNDYPDEVDDAVNRLDLIFVDDVDDNPDDFIDDGYTKQDINKADQALGDYVMPDTLNDVDADTVNQVIDWILHELENL